MKPEQIDLVGRQINFEAPEHVRAVIASLGRTEDVKLSPSNRHLILSDHFSDQIVAFGVSIDSGNSKSITINSVTKISSKYLQRPHGFDFIDDKRIIVANRIGQACIFELPSNPMDNCELDPLAIFNFHEISSPGSVAVIRNDPGSYEALICNDYVNKVTRHILEVGEGCSVKNDRVLLSKWIHFPDGICVSKDQKWIAVSNHDTHAVFLYKNDSSLNAQSDPDGILRHYYPHGLRFASADQFLIAASAGSPYVNVYQALDSDWRGVRSPILSLKVLSNEDYLRARISREDGGPKGVDINNAMDVLVLTCEQHPLAFFDLDPILKHSRLQSSLASPKSVKLLGDRTALEVRYELYSGKIRAASTSSIRWVLRKIPSLSWLLNKGRKIWNPQFLTKPF